MNPNLPYPALRLRPKEDRRLRAGHPWIYSNEVDTRATPLTAIAPGSVCRVEDAGGAALGLAHVNPHTLLCGRMLSRDADERIDTAFYRRRLEQALTLRRSLFARPFYRLVHGEGDLLPGLVIDRYEDYLVIQPGSLGMEQDLTLLQEALLTVLHPTGILIKGSGPARGLEGLAERVEVLHGHIPEILEVEENDCRFHFSPRTGQKTGWFYDHRANRARLRPLAQGRRVLDLFSYLGAFAIPLAQAGALAVTAVDASAHALERARSNAARNGVANLSCVEADAFDYLRDAAARGEQFDVIALDPPALAKNRGSVAGALRGYRELNLRAMRLLAPGGLLFTASCSYHVSKAMFLDVVREAAADSQRTLILRAVTGQPLDHPEVVTIPETGYLKGVLLEAGA